MRHSIVKRGYGQAKKLLLIQLMLVLILAMTALFINYQAALALLAGGLVVLIGNTLFVYVAFSKSGAQASKQVVRSLYLGEAAKIILLGALMAIALIFLSGFEIYVLGGYIAALLAQWLTPVIVKTN